MNEIFLGLPPNIYRKTSCDISELFPGVRVLPPRTHGEDQNYIRRLFCERSSAREEYPALMITPDPEVMGSSDWIEGSGYFEKFDGGLPPLGSSVKGYISDAPTEFMKIIAVIPLNIIYNRAIGITIESWKDLCIVAETGRIITPPHDTPLPQLYRHFLNRLLGERAAGVIEKTDHALYPLDINKAVDEGQYGAGVVFPAFARSSRLGNVVSCCPREGVIALPVVAVKRKGASEKADAIVRYLLGREFQEYLSYVGDMLPVLEGVHFPEGVAEDSKLLWDGWELFKKFIQ